MQLYFTLFKIGKKRQSAVIKHDEINYKIICGMKVVFLVFGQKIKKMIPKYRKQIETTVRSFTYLYDIYSGFNQPRNIQYLSDNLQYV